MYLYTSSRASSCQKTTPVPYLLGVVKLVLLCPLPLLLLIKPEFSIASLVPVEIVLSHAGMKGKYRLLQL